MSVDSLVRASREEGVDAQEASWTLGPVQSERPPVDEPKVERHGGVLAAEEPQLFPQYAKLAADRVLELRRVLSSPAVQSLAPMKLPCAKCGSLHDIADLEPSLARPDAFLAVPPSERADRTQATNDLCSVRDGDNRERRWFVRVLVPFPVRGLERPCCWGVWSEVSAPDYAKVVLLWNDPDQCSHPPFRAVLANDLDGYPPTAGLRGTIAFRNVDSIPFFEFDADVQHPFAEEARAGVTPERVLEWLTPFLHGRPLVGVLVRHDQ